MVLNLHTVDSLPDFSLLPSHHRHTGTVLGLPWQRHGEEYNKTLYSSQVLQNRARGGWREEAWLIGHSWRVGWVLRHPRELLETFGSIFVIVIGSTYELQSGMVDNL